jgi:Aldo/keto reductase family
MVRRRDGQGLLGEVVLFGVLGTPETLLDPALRRVDALLGDEALIDTVWAVLRQRRPQSARRGRPGTPAEVVLRLLVLKHAPRCQWRVAAAAAAHRSAVDRPGRLRTELLQSGQPRRRRARRPMCARGHRVHVLLPAWRLQAVQSDVLDHVASRLYATPFQVALAWLLHRSPTTLLIPGTSSVAHLRENVEGAGIELPSDTLEELNTIGR